MHDAFSHQAQEQIAREVGERQHHARDGAVRGLLRVNIEARCGLTFHAQSPGAPGFTLVVDEPPARGGEDQGPPPLMYFLTAVGSCLLTQFVRLSVAWGIDVQVRDMQVRGEWDRAVGGSFKAIRQEIHAHGTASREDVERLAAAAEDFCYIHATLRDAVSMTTVVHLNDSETITRTTEPPARVQR